MYITTRFRPGDQIFLLQRTAVMAALDCPICSGDGHIHLPMNPKQHSITDEALTLKTYPCPECQASGKREHQASTRYVVIANPYTVELIQIEVIADGDNISYEFRDAQLIRQEKELFATYAEAQAACDKLNAAKAGKEANG